MKSLNYAIDDKMGSIIIEVNGSYKIIKTNLELWRELHRLWKGEPLYKYKAVELKNASLELTGESDNIDSP